MSVVVLILGQNLHQKSRRDKKVAGVRKSRGFESDGSWKKR